LRELASAAAPVQLTPGEQIFWDRRFTVALPPSGRDPLTIGYLGPAGVAQLNRLGEQRRQRRLPRLLFPTLPAAWDNDEIVAVPHLGYLREEIGAVPQFILRPANPLTRAGFVVV
jgi:tRNA(Ile)-lysidine synthase